MNNKALQIRASKLLRLSKFGIGLTFVAILFLPVDLSAIQPAVNSASKTKDVITDKLRSDLLYVHCCHSHPRPPYDSYCCHSGAAHVARGAVAYGAYRGVKSAAKKHYKRAPRRRR